jgi:hypothetical protein
MARQQMNTPRPELEALAVVLRDKPIRLHSANPPTYRQVSADSLSRMASYRQKIRTEVITNYFRRQQKGRTVSPYALFHCGLAWLN